MWILNISNSNYYLAQKPVKIFPFVCNGSFQIRNCLVNEGVSCRVWQMSYNHLLWLLRWNQRPILDLQLCLQVPQLKTVINECVLLLALFLMCLSLVASCRNLSVGGVRAAPIGSCDGLRAPKCWGQHCKTGGWPWKCLCNGFLFYSAILHKRWPSAFCHHTYNPQERTSQLGARHKSFYAGDVTALKNLSVWNQNLPFNSHYPPQTS